ncbi:hypothetical protein BJ970_001303 [Saccharopolyspora phatthalungensis]|uniref:Uncharacterized protein n=1 Tax=Saccharopolyspora phatthalungensis TaxID=664693 RepID=A0A840Q505_9PSEU|nr:hypothetical protein [Saccharopolyspora phatthalungensis]
MEGNAVISIEIAGTGTDRIQVSIQRWLMGW